jgi:hypothetical protein
LKIGPNWKFLKIKGTQVFSLTEAKKQHIRTGSYEWIHVWNPRSAWVPVSASAKSVSKCFHASLMRGPLEVQMRPRSEAAGEGLADADTGTHADLGFQTWIHSYDPVRICCFLASVRLKTWVPLIFRNFQLGPIFNFQYPPV